MQESADAPVKGARLSSTARRELLLDAAARIILERGFEALTMEALSAEAQVSRGLGYVHFKNAAEVACALYDRELGELSRRMEMSAAGTESFERRARRAIEAYLDYVKERGLLIGVLQTKLIGRPLSARIRARMFRFADFWAGLIQAESAAPKRSARALAAAAMVATDSLGRAYYAGRISRAEAQQFAVGFFLEALRAAGAAAGESR